MFDQLFCLQLGWIEASGDAGRKAVRCVSMCSVTTGLPCHLKVFALSHAADVLFSDSQQKA